jgi:sulfite reductase beta subunit-like hemoprotein
MSAATYDQTVRADIEEFAGHIEKFLAGELTDDAFRAVRLRRGIYGQRQAGVQMVRTKIPGGIMTAGQMDVLAEIATHYAAGKSHLTTRQNVQFHFVPIRSVPALLGRLADVRLTTREACYNTVRNVTGSALTGLFADEVFDIGPYVRTTALAFLHQELTDSMPRKFKIAFAGGSPKDDIVAAMNDVGLTAKIVDGQKGFRMTIGAGLGPVPMEAHVLDEFIPVERVVNRIEAVIRVFNAHGNRKNKHKARLKFVIRERGFDWVKEAVEKQYADILANGGIATPTEIPEGFGGFRSKSPALGDGNLLPVLGATFADPGFDRWLETNIREQKQTGYSMVTIRVQEGNLTDAQMHGLANIARDAGDGLIRVSVDQNLMIGFVPVFNLKRAYAALKALDLAKAGAGEIEDVTTCPGAYSCNLALTKSMNLGAALSETVASYTDPAARKLSIKISGCPNSCGQHWLADFGFFGNSKKIDGREVPYYQMMLGGGFDKEGMLRYAFTTQSIPARLAPIAVRRVLDHYLLDRRKTESFREYVLRNKVEFFRGLTYDLIKPAELTPEMFQDWGDDVAYSLQLGKGECAA